MRSVGARISAAMCAGGRTLSEPRLSPDGRAVAVVVSVAGATSLVVVPATGGSESILTTAPAIRRGWGVFDWMPDGSGVVYVGSDGELQLQDIAGGPPRRLARTEGASAPAVSPDGRRVAFTVDGRHVAVASLEPGDPWPVRISAVPDFCADPAWSPDGSQVAWHEWDVPAMAWDDSRIVVGAYDSWSLPVPVPVPVPSPSAVAQPRFSPGGELGWLCDASGWLNLWHRDPAGTAQPFLEERCEHGPPTWGDGSRSWVWSPDGSRIAFTRNLEGFGELCLLDVDSGDVRSLDRGVFAGLSWSDRSIAALRSGARAPDQVVVYRMDEGAPRAGSAASTSTKPPRITVARGPVLGFEAAEMVEPEVVHWVGEDVPALGPEVHGRLFRTGRHCVVGSADPDATPPLIVWVHGGPTGQHQVGFNARAAYFLDRGWNLLQVDHRGSTGWGRAYAQALRGEWGRLDVDDVVTGITAAVAARWGDPRRIVVMGGSSAGLTVLSILSRYPGMCAAGIDLYGVTDLFGLEEATHRFEAHYNSIMVGALPGAASVWRERSPIANAAAIRDPLLVMHGSSDKVVPLEQSERLMRALNPGVPAELHVYDGEGHGWSRPATVADELSRIDAFLTRHVLKGTHS